MQTPALNHIEERIQFDVSTKGTTGVVSKFKARSGKMQKLMQVLSKDIDVNWRVSSTWSFDKRNPSISSRQSIRHVKVIWHTCTSHLWSWWSLTCNGGHEGDEALSTLGNLQGVNVCNVLILGLPGCGGG